MGLGSELEHADHFAAYVNELTKLLGHADQTESALRRTLPFLLQLKYHR
jgi:hypothetical protein